MSEFIEDTKLEKTVLIYFFDLDTGAYLEQGYAFVDKEGDCLCPSNATQVSPPAKIEPGYAASWNGKAWTQVKDFRGRYWDKITLQEIIITRLGDVPSETLTTVEPPVIEVGYAIVWENNGWVIKEDHRGIIIFDIGTAIASTLLDLGPIPEGYTEIVPACEYPIWNGSTWIVNEELKTKIETAETTKQVVVAEKTALIAETFKTWTDVEKAIDSAKSIDDIKLLLKQTLKIQFISETGTSIAAEKVVVEASKEVL
jgi:hypothetical protein